MTRTIGIRIRRTLVAAASVWVAGGGTGAIAQPLTTLPPPVAAALAQAKVPASAIGVYVKPVGAAEPLIAIGADKPLNPASSMKIVTTYAGLELLGPAYQWKTGVLADGPVTDGVLQGNLYLRGGGDPKLTIENLWLMLRELRARGIRSIRGDLVLDRSLFAGNDNGIGSFDNQPDRPYNTLPGALLTNFKSVTLRFVPEPATQTVRIITEPPLREITVVNNLRLVNGPCGDWQGRMKYEGQHTADSARLTFSGSYSADCGENVDYFNVLGHRQYTGSLFLHLWSELGGTLEGQLRDGEVPAGARLITTGQSSALSEIVRDINKYSNNVMARQLFLTLGQDGAGPATTAAAARRVTQWLTGKGVDVSGFVIDNGSGLSRNARISARTLGSVLGAAFDSPVMPELMASMPLVAVDGTLRRHLKHAAVAGHAHVKTGYLAGVRSIAGTVLDANGQRWVVVFMVNHANAVYAQPAMNALIAWVHDQDNAGCCGRQEKRQTKRQERQRQRGKQ